MTETNPRILYIEDDHGSQHLVRRVLERHGYEVLVAPEGAEGLELARAQQPNLILMDINLPGMNGREVTTRLRGMAGFERVPIVALTANLGDQARAQALAAGCNGFLTKPIDVIRFPEEVRAFLDGREEDLPQEQRLSHLELHAQEMVAHLEAKITELEEANARLRELDREKSIFITLVSHELRTPLTLVEGYMYLIHDHLKQADGINQEWLQEMTEGLRAGVERMHTLIEDVVLISRIAVGELQLAQEPVSLRYIAGLLERDAIQVAGERQLTVEVRGFEDLPHIEADEVLLYGALSRLLENALKFTPDGGQVVLAGARLNARTVEIVIQDTGIGIPPTEQQRIFEHFYVLGNVEHHTSSKTAFKGGGLGLGLPIARGIIEAHRGRIYVDSEENVGTTFHVILPIRQPRQRPLPPAEL